MKKILASLMALAFCSPVLANDSIDLYGRVHQVLTHESVDTGPNKMGGSMTVRDANSRFGIRGSEDLGDGLRAIFAYEFGVVTDAVSDAPLSSRHAYLGLKTADYGTFVVGSQDGGNDSQAPLYNQAVYGLKTVSYNAGPLAFVGSGSTGANIFGTQNFIAIDRQQRTGNALGYALGVDKYYISARYSQLGTDDLSNNTITGQNQFGAPVVSSKESGVRATEVAVTWTDGPLMIGGGASYIDRQESQKPTPINAFTRLKGTYQAVASYDFGFVRVGGLAAQNNLMAPNPFNSKDSNTEYAMTVAAPIGLFQGVMFSVADSERNNAFSAQDIRQYQLAYNYDFSRRTRVYAGLNYSKIDADGQLIPQPSRTQKALAVGMTHNF